LLPLRKHAVLQAFIIFAGRSSSEQD